MWKTTHISEIISDDLGLYIPYFLHIYLYLEVLKEVYIRYCGQHCVPKPEYNARQVDKRSHTIDNLTV